MGNGVLGIDVSKKVVNKESEHKEYANVFNKQHEPIVTSGKVVVDKHAEVETKPVEHKPVVIKPNEESVDTSRVNCTVSTPSVDQKEVSL